MGEVARIGISQGKRVPVHELVHHSGIPVDPFVGKCFQELGCSEQIHSILAGDALTEEQVIFLLEEAPISVVTKLVEVLGYTFELSQSVHPMVMLPLESWTRASSLSEATDLALRFLRALPCAEVDVAIDWLDLSQLESLLEVGEFIARGRPGIRFIGPSIEEISSFLAGETAAPNRSLTKAISRRLDDFLFAIRKAGFYRLRFSTDLDLAEVLEVPARLRDAGILAVLGTPIDREGGALAVAADLSRLAKASALGEWDIWLPTLSDQFEGMAVKDPVTDVRILRALAVGSLSLNQVPLRRASSTFLSLDGLLMARYFGANDLGYGALDATTTEMMKLLPYKTLVEATMR